MKIIFNRRLKQNKNPPVLILCNIKFIFNFKIVCHYRLKQIFGILKLIDDQEIIDEILDYIYYKYCNEILKNKYNKYYNKYCNYIIDKHIYKKEIVLFCFNNLNNKTRKYINKFIDNILIEFEKYLDIIKKNYKNKNDIKINNEDLKQEFLEYECSDEYIKAIMENHDNNRYDIENNIIKHWTNKYEIFYFCLYNNLLFILYI